MLTGGYTMSTSRLSRTHLWDRSCRSGSILQGWVTVMHRRLTIEKFLRTAILASMLVMAMAPSASAGDIYGSIRTEDGSSRQNLTIEVKVRLAVADLAGDPPVFWLGFFDFR